MKTLNQELHDSIFDLQQYLHRTHGIPDEARAMAQKAADRSRDVILHLNHADSLQNQLENKAAEVRELEELLRMKGGQYRLWVKLRAWMYFSLSATVLILSWVSNGPVRSLGVVKAIAAAMVLAFAFSFLCWVLLFSKEMEDWLRRRLRRMRKASFHLA